MWSPPKHPECRQSSSRDRVARAGEPSREASAGVNSYLPQTSFNESLLLFLPKKPTSSTAEGVAAYEASGIWKSAHNEYLDRMFELGTIGLSINLYLLYVLVSRTRRLLSDSSENMRRLQIGYIFAVLIMFVDIFFVAIPDPWTVIWVITGLLFGLQSLVETNGQSAEDPTLKDSDQIENKHGLKRA